MDEFVNIDSARVGTTTDTERIGYWRKRAEEAEQCETALMIRCAGLRDALVEIEKMASCGSLIEAAANKALGYPPPVAR